MVSSNDGQGTVTVRLARQKSAAKKSAKKTGKKNNTEPPVFWSNGWPN
jgi:flagellar basal body L-ring protein FlgH